MRGHNFSAGPGTLPTAVMQAVRDELLEYPSTGASIIEISHRSPQYTAVAASARALLRKLLGLGEEWHILFLQGGASTQFYQVAHNFLLSDRVATYVNTGNWSTKAIAEARRYGGVQVAASSEDEQFSYIPSEADWNVAEDSVYLHYTSNNTIFGTQYRTEPTVSAPLVCDASSDFLSRPLDLDRYGLIYAGAQKNIGPAGATVVLVRDDFLQTRRADLPTMMDYGTHAAKLFNTPPVFAVYMVEKVLRWLDDLGGIPAIQVVNQQKADLLYGRIDRTDFYSGTARANSRSLMNVTFRLPSPELDAQFIAEAQANNLLNLKGYRTVGGIRASIYNACPMEAVEALVSFMDDFEAANG